MLMVLVVLMRMGVTHRFVGVLVGVRATVFGVAFMRMIVMTIIMRVLVRMCDSLVGVVV